eukprot:6195585-Pleurochrysis_carterae.AAC.1
MNASAYLCALKHCACIMHSRRLIGRLDARGARLTQSILMTNSASARAGCVKMPWKKKLIICMYLASRTGAAQRMRQGQERTSWTCCGGAQDA